MTTFPDYGRAAASLRASSRLCGCSFIHPHQSLAQGLERVRRLGFDWADVGIGGANGHFNPVEVAQAPLVYSDQIRRELPEGMRLNECFTLNFGPPINTPDAAVRRQTRTLFEGLCRFARSAGFRSVLLIPGPIHDDLGLEHSLDLAAEALIELVKIAGAHDVWLNLEADCEGCARTPEAAVRLCHQVPGLGLTLDYSHFVVQNIDAKRIEGLHPYARHLHVRQAAPGHIVTDVDAGCIDYARIVQDLETSGYRGLYAIEYLSLRADKAVYVQSEARTAAMQREIVGHLLTTCTP
jgi:sugar phosphate isomerase/epimerase